MAIDRNETFDVIVVGAGPAGSAAALRLAEQRVKVLETVPHWNER